MSNSTKYHWTEEYHDTLKDMNPNDAIKDVESMSDHDVLYRVNMRKFQQDYIADYLEYLWELSPKDFWRHIEIMFSDETEFLLSDNMNFVCILCNEVAPVSVINSVVKYTVDKWIGDGFETINESLYKDILSEIIQEQNKLSISGIKLIDIYPSDQSGMDELEKAFNEIIGREIRNSYKSW